MNKVFCVSCGTKNIYEVIKPKFCASCGTQISGLIIKKQQMRQNDTVEAEQESEESIDISSIDLRKLRRDVVAETHGSKITLQDLWKSASPSDIQDAGKFSRPAPNLPQGQDLIKLNTAECSARQITQIDG